MVPGPGPGPPEGHKANNLNGKTGMETVNILKEFLPRKCQTSAAQYTFKETFPAEREKAESRRREKNSQDG